MTPKEEYNYAIDLFRADDIRDRIDNEPSMDPLEHAELLYELAELNHRMAVAMLKDAEDKLAVRKNALRNIAHHIKEDKHLE